MKKLNKFFAVLVALAMMATLCVSMAFAEVPKAQSLASANLLKQLDVAEGVTVPSATFNFTITPKDSFTTANASTVNTSLSFSSTDTIIEDKVVKGKTLDEFFAISKTDVAGKVTLKSAGVYVFTVDETETGTATIENGTMTYDEGTYTLRIYVKNGENGPELDSITVSDDTVDTETDKDAGKTDPNVGPKDDNNTPSDPSDDTYTDETDGGLRFVNNFTKKNTTTPTTDPDALDGALNVQKKVSGDMASTTTDFPFTLTLTLPTTYTIADADTFTATVYGAGGAQSGEKKVKAFKKADFTNNVATWNFDLKAGETLKFDVLPYGSTYTVTENLATVAGAENYTPAYTLLHLTSKTGEAGKNLTAPQTGETAIISDVEAENNDELVYTNTYKDVTPEGILISNLPYIALALVAIGGLVAYVVIRRRNADEA